MGAPHAYSFGPFRFDAAAYQLFAGDRPVQGLDEIGHASCRLDGEAGRGPQVVDVLAAPLHAVAQRSFISRPGTSLSH